MSKKRNRRKPKKVKSDLDSGWIEQDDHFGFIIGYTSNGVPYGLNHEEWGACHLNPAGFIETDKSDEAFDSSI